MNWLTYLLEANIYLGVFYLCYCLLLNRDTHYTLNRVYLLASCILAFVLPITQLSILKPVEPEVVAQPVSTQLVQPMAQFIPPPPPPQAPTLFTQENVLISIYAIGVLAALAIFGMRLYKLFRLSRAGRREQSGSYRIVYLDKDNTAFSFFNYLFIGNNVSSSSTILNHELVHIRQRHSADIIFMELLKAINWFNPFIYLTERSLKTIHEYIADEQTAANEQDTLTYSSFLLQNAYGIQGSSIAHSFFNYNLLKKRIIMLNQKRSGRLARLKYLAVVPLCGGMLCTSTLVFSKDYGVIDLSPKVAESAKPDLIKYFMIKDLEKDITAYADNMSITEDGVEKFYRAITITEADIAHILKRHKLKIEVIDVDSKTYRPVPRVEFADMKGDTVPKKIKKEQVPAPPPMSKKSVKAPGILPPPPPPPVKSKKAPGVLPPPPPVEKPNKSAGNFPPPPPPYQTVYNDLVKYMGKHVRYPTAAYNKKLNGDVLLSLRLDENHKITDIKVVKGIGSGCDEEVIRALKSYEGTIDKPSGNYQLMTTFMLINDKDGKSYFPKPISGDIAGKSNFIGQVVIAGSLNIATPPVVTPTTNGKAEPNEKPAKISNKSRALISLIESDKQPLLIIDGRKFIPPVSPTRQFVKTSGTDSVRYYPPGNIIAMQKWGKDAHMAYKKVGGD